MSTQPDANTQKVLHDLEIKREEAKPVMGFLHHIAATQAMQTGFTVTLIDGTTYTADKGDFVFTDGLSIVQGGHRIYFPTTAIRSILVHNPGHNK
jgi:hypothetical protein